MLIPQIKERMRAALKARRTVEKEILGVALGELETEAARKGTLSDDEGFAIVRKIVKSNRETLAASESAEQKKTLEEEIAVLESLLPKALGLEEVEAALSGARDAIKAAGNDGQATGIAMKTLKASGAVVDGKLVGEVVRKMRAG
ncbi:MAG TPA: GatB/YqeY domain-containing protein [Polyangiaceae bacterium]|nr:GatB/YqeY domain-containing protein [Polyangiaceae bacterium]